MWWTFASAVLGATTALFVACVVYPWQKSVDRANDLAREKRAIIRDLVNEITDYTKLSQTSYSDDARLLMLAALLDSYGDRDFADEIIKFSNAHDRRSEAFEQRENGIMSDDEYASVREEWKQANTTIRQRVRVEMKKHGYKHISMRDWLRAQLGASQ